MLLEPFELTKLQRFESQLKELNCQAPLAPLYIPVKSKKRLNVCILRLSFLPDLVE